MFARVSVTFAVLMVVVSGAAIAKPIDRQFEENFDVAPGTILHPQHGDGDVSIEAWEEDQIQVEVRYYYDVKRRIRQVGSGS